ncbi:MAG: DsrE family protein, partial [Candidatus Desantisbacteria bacterium]
MVKNILFVVRTPPYKSENPKLAITHAMACYVADIHIDEEVIPTMAFIEDGVLNCLKNQRSLEFYGIISTEQHIKNQLASDMKMLICKEDLENLGINEDRLVDAKDMGAEVSFEVVCFEKIQEEMERCDQIMF